VTAGQQLIFRLPCEFRPHHQCNRILWGSPTGRLVSHWIMPQVRSDMPAIRLDIGAGSSSVSFSRFNVSIVLICTMFSPPYDALKVDVWSLGATIWETAEAEPPFSITQQLSDRWPPLSKPKLFSPAFHDFLRQCSEPAASRPSPASLCSVCI
jgi:serine/threonine protein kinase